MLKMPFTWLFMFCFFISRQLCEGRNVSINNVMLFHCDKQYGIDIFGAALSKYLVTAVHSALVHLRHFLPPVLGVMPAMSDSQLVVSDTI